MCVCGGGGGLQVTQALGGRPTAWSPPESLHEFSAGLHGE